MCEGRYSWNVTHTVFHSDAGGSQFLWNGDMHLQACMASHGVRLYLCCLTHSTFQ